MYAHSQLTKHARWAQPYFTVNKMQQVMATIAERSCGVFLRVSLATRSLRDGLVNVDTFADLKRQFERLPTDLELFLKHMLDIVDDDYHERMGHILRIAVNARRPLQLQIYYMHEFERTDTGYAINMLVVAHTPNKMHLMLDQCRRRINARSGGLLEIKEGRVEFRHRTVRDFLLTREMSDYLAHKSGSRFKVNFATLKSYIFLFRCWTQTTEWLPLAEDQSFRSNAL